MKYPNIQRVTVARGRLGAAMRWFPDDVPQRVRDLEVSKLAAHISAVVGSNPPTADQAAELAAMLVSPVGDTPAALPVKAA